MPKPKSKYDPTCTFTVEADGFYGEYYEPEKILFPGKAMVVCSGSDGSFLLISGGADVMVPAEWVCEEVMRRLDEHGFCYPHRHLNYEILSHYTCPLRPMTSFLFKVERKHKAECNANRARSWQDTLSFLRDEWQL